MNVNLAMGSIRLSNAIYEPVFRKSPVDKYGSHTVILGNKEEGNEITLPLLSYNLQGNSLNIFA